MAKHVMEADHSASTGPRVGPLREEQTASLATFLAGRPDATVFHSPAWAGVIADTYGHDCHYWVATQGEAIAGAFPVTEMRVPGLGCKHVAMPYQMHSGAPLAATAAIRDALLEAAIAGARKAGSKYLEVRHFEEASWLEAYGFVRVDSGLVTTTIPIDSLDLTQTSHGHRQRVRKAVKLGVSVERSDSIDDLRTFRRMYLETGRAMGAPQAGWPYFAATHERVGTKTALYFARREGSTVGGFFVLGDEHLTFARCSAHSSREALKSNAGHALWWQAMQDAAQAGCKEFNCGITWIGDTGLIDWKEGWGGTSRPVYTYVLPLRSKPPEAGGYFEGYAFAKAVWKRLPLPVADVIGHNVTRWIG
jgi:Acetyltransferase (GNAT) domain